MHKGRIKLGNRQPAACDFYFASRSRAVLFLKRALATERVLYISGISTGPAGSLSRVNRSYPERKMNFHSLSLNPFRITALARSLLFLSGIFPILTSTSTFCSHTYTHTYVYRVFQEEWSTFEDMIVQVIF